MPKMFSRRQLAFESSGSSGLSLGSTGVGVSAWTRDNDGKEKNVATKALVHKRHFQEDLPAYTKTYRAIAAT